MAVKPIPKPDNDMIKAFDEIQSQQLRRAVLNLCYGMIGKDGLDMPGMKEQCEFLIRQTRESKFKPETRRKIERIQIQLLYPLLNGAEQEFTYQVCALAMKADKAQLMKNLPARKKSGV